MSVIRTQAIVLRRTNYGEADRILQILTPEGKISVMARGVRREKSRLAGGIELFAVSDIVVQSGKGDLGILTSARLINYYRHILEDYDRMQFGYEAIKQVSRGSEQIDESEWFMVMGSVLKALDIPGVPLSLIQTWFYLRYAALLGYELSMQYDTNGDKLLQDGRYRYDVSEKGFTPVRDGPVGAEHIKLFRLMMGQDIEVIMQVGGISDLLHDCADVARAHAAL